MIWTIFFSGRDSYTLWKHPHLREISKRVFLCCWCSTWAWGSWRNIIAVMRESCFEHACVCETARRDFVLFHALSVLRVGEFNVGDFAASFLWEWEQERGIERITVYSNIVIGWLTPWFVLKFKCHLTNSLRIHTSGKDRASTCYIPVFIHCVYRIFMRSLSNCSGRLLWNTRKTKILRSRCKFSRNGDK